MKYDIKFGFNASSFINGYASMHFAQKVCDGKSSGVSRYERGEKATKLLFFLVQGQCSARIERSMSSTRLVCTQVRFATPRASNTRSLYRNGIGAEQGNLQVTIQSLINPSMLHPRLLWVQSKDSVPSQTLFQQNERPPIRNVLPSDICNVNSTASQVLLLLSLPRANWIVFVKYSLVRFS